MRRLSTDRLVTVIASQLKPVQPLPAPWLRASQWLLVLSLVLAVLVTWLGDRTGFARRIVAPSVLAECAGAVITAVLSALAAFHLSVPGESPRWRLVPFACSALWLIGMLATGWQRLIEGPALTDSAWGSLNCFGFVVGLSLPVTGTLLVLLRRSYPLAPIPVAAAAGLTAGALATLVLEFFHTDLSGPVDLAAHVAAVGVVVSAAALFGDRALR